MKKKVSPAEFLGAKVLTPTEQANLRGGIKTNQQQRVAREPYRTKTESITDPLEKDTDHLF